MTVRFRIPWGGEAGLGQGHVAADLVERVALVIRWEGRICLHWPDQLLLVGVVKFVQPQRFVLVEPSA